MKIVEENNYNRFPMYVTCRRVVDKYGFDYGRDEDFCGSKLEVDTEDIKKHKWYKYPHIEGIDYGVVCPKGGMFIHIEDSDIPKCIKENAE